MTAPVTDPPAADVLWHSPPRRIGRAAVAIRYQRGSPEQAWQASGLLVSDGSGTLGSTWIKGFPWRRMTGPHAPGIVWESPPTIDVLAAAYGAAGHLLPSIPGAAPAPPPASAAPPEPPARAEPGAGTADDAAARRAALRAARLQRVAAVYTESVREDGTPVVAVAQDFAVPRTTAVNWVREARVLGYLPPTRKGRTSA